MSVIKCHLVWFENSHKEKMTSNIATVCSIYFFYVCLLVNSIYLQTVFCYVLPLGASFGLQIEDPISDVMIPRILGPVGIPVSGGFVITGPPSFQGI